MAYNPHRIAHRGDSTTAPENTFEAVRSAVDFGCEGVEIDVRLTKDNKIVLMHDEYINRMIFNGDEIKRNIRLRDIDWCDLEKVKIPYENHLLPDFPEGGIIVETELFDFVDNRMLGRDSDSPYRKTDNSTTAVLLEEIIIWVLHNSPTVFLEVECKDIGIAKHLEELILRTNAYDRVILMSGDVSIVDEYQKHFVRDKKLNKVRLGANIRHLDDDWKNKLEYFELYEVGLNPVNLNMKDVTFLHNKNLKVFSNLGDYPEWWESLHRLHIDGFKTNYIREYTSWLNNR